MKYIRYEKHKISKYSINGIAILIETVITLLPPETGVEDNAWDPSITPGLKTRAMLANSSSVWSTSVVSIGVVALVNCKSELLREATVEPDLELKNNIKITTFQVFFTFITNKIQNTIIQCEVNILKLYKFSRKYDS